jgi:hypothetical protein
MTLEIVEGRALHVGPVASAIDDLERGTFAAFQVKPRVALREMVRQSAYCRTGLLDGRPVAMWGVTGPAVASGGEVWLALSLAARQRRFLIVRTALREVRAMMAFKHELVSCLFCREARAFRFADFLGFEVEQAIDGQPYRVARLRRG